MWTRGRFEELCYDWWADHEHVIDDVREALAEHAWTIAAVAAIALIMLVAL